MSSEPKAFTSNLSGTSSQAKSWKTYLNACSYWPEGRAAIPKGALFFHDWLAVKHVARTEKRNIQAKANGKKITKQIFPLTLLFGLVHPSVYSENIYSALVAHLQAFCWVP